MQPSVDTRTYKSALEKSLCDICFDRSSGERFSFEELFYPLGIDEGSFAFQSYSEQMDRAHKLADFSKGAGIPAGKKMTSAAEIGQKIRKLQSKISTENSRYAGNAEKAVSQPASDRRITGKEILKKIEQRQRLHSEAESKNNETSEAADINCLYTENEFSRSSLIVSDDRDRSRIIAIASAGHGKTTLLRRVALFFCHYDSDSAEHLALKRKYELAGDFIPCMIRLRDIGNHNFALESAIEKSVTDVLESAGETFSPAAVHRWINKERRTFLLLIDGLDELSDSMRPEFLHSLEDYLELYPLTRVILSSRVAGLSEPGVMESLGRMGFRGRSIIPLTDEEAKQYSEKWIEVTQPAEQHEMLKDAVDQVLNQNRFKYLREFMRTPLELIVILKQLANDTLSLNRFQMFHDMLWELFTNHVKQFSQKRPVFDDTMTLLSFIAYQMQLRDSLFISAGEIRELAGQLSHLSFHTDMMGKGTPEDYIGVLDGLAANVGIVEKDDRSNERVYTFPIRAYQEYLTAHACCHLRLDPAKPRPDAYSVISSHLNDSRWISITNFALSDLGTNNQNDFDALISLVFQKVTDLEQLRAIVESDLAITRTHAELLCRSVFTKGNFTDGLRDLLVACMNTRSSYAYAHVLRNEYQNARKSDILLGANAVASVIWEYNAGQSAAAAAVRGLKSGTEKGVELGTEMLYYISVSCLEEKLCEYSAMARKDLEVTDEMVDLLCRNDGGRGVQAAKALTALWLTKCSGYDKVRPALTVSRARAVVDEINRNAAAAHRLCSLGTEAQRDPEYSKLHELFYTLGSFPVNSDKRPLLRHNGEDIFVSALLDAMYEISKSNPEEDQTALAVASLFYFCDMEAFARMWGDDICGGIPSAYVRKVSGSRRGRNHFSLVRRMMKDIEAHYYSIIAIRTNVLDRTPGGLGSYAVKTDTDNLTVELSRGAALNESAYVEKGAYGHRKDVNELFRERNYREAVQVCAEEMRSGNETAKVNLAFLMRFAKPDLRAAGIDDCTIPGLLSDGVKNGDCFALLNMALYEMEQKHYAAASELLSAIDVKGWHDVTEKFWLPVMWEDMREPEGALVCMLAHKLGDCVFDDYANMQQAVGKAYGSICDEVLDNTRQ